MDSQDRWLSEMWQAPKSRTDIWLRLPGWKERERGEVHEARKPYEAISLADSDRERRRGSKSPSTKIGTIKTKLGLSKCGFVIQFSRIALFGFWGNPIDVRNGKVDIARGDVFTLDKCASKLEWKFNFFGCQIPALYMLAEFTSASQVCAEKNELHVSLWIDF